MPWLQFILETTEKKADIYSEHLMEAGAVAVTFLDAKDHAIFEPQVGATPLWNHTRVVGLFDADVDIAAVKFILQERLNEKALDTLQIEPLEDKNWTTAWMDQFHPMRFGQKLWIYPSWSELPSNNDITIVQLDPGMAFGTGTHATTALCLEWLDQSLPHTANATVIDYGCGSGVLGIAALKLGAKKVYAVDHDPQALQSTKTNAEKNNLNELAITTFFPEDFKHFALPQKVDVLLANILAYPLIELAPTLAGFIKPGGHIVLSGILEKQAEVIVEAYTTLFENLKIEVKDEWVRVTGIKSV